MTKKEKQQLEIFTADASWFHIFKELIRNKTWAKLSASATKLYPVIKSFINHQSGSAFPSIDTLEEFSGLSRPSIIKALKELEVEGLLIKSTNGRNSNYSVVEKFDVKNEQGKPTASVSFDYMPAYVKDAVAELRNFVAEDGKVNYIKIEYLTLNIINGEHGTVNNNNQIVTPEDAIKSMKEILKKN